MIKNIVWKKSNPEMGFHELFGIIGWVIDEHFIIDEIVKTKLKWRIQALRFQFCPQQGINQPRIYPVLDAVVYIQIEKLPENICHQTAFLHQTI